MLSSSSILNVITKPTRVSSRFLINYILTNDMSNTIYPGVIQTDMLSDHFPIFYTISKTNRILSSPNKIIYVLAINV